MIAAAYFFRWGILHLLGGVLPPYITFYPAVMLVAMVSGLGPGLLATGLAAVATLFFILLPYGRPGSLDHSDLIALVLFGGINIFFCFMAERYRQMRFRMAKLVKQRTEALEESRQSAVASLENARQAERQAKQVETALRESNERLKRVLEVETVGVMFWDLTTGCLVDANDTFLRFMGYTRSDVEARSLTWQRLTPPEYIDLSLAEVRKFMETGRVGPYEKEYLHKDGTRQWLVFAGSSLGNNMAVEFCVDISDRKRTEAALRESEARFRSLIEGAPEGVYIQCDDIYQYVNKAMVALAGATRAEDLLGTPSMDRIAPEFHEIVRQRNRLQSETGQASPLTEVEYVRLDGTRVRVEAMAVLVDFRDQKGHMVFMRDITERRKAEMERASLEAQLRQAQKMESVGRLAGGVAHDFNNLLMGIMGHAELCRDAIKQGDPACVHLDAIIDAAQRSAGITRQLLAFARKQTVAPVVLDINDHVSGTLKLLRQLIGENIELAWLPVARRSTVMMDPSQIDQILANLAVNARDAIDGVGKVTFETRDAVLDAAFCAEHKGAVPGAYVMLAVSDTGCGMDSVTLEHIFEPFFTTKDVGKGTGLGLATVYGIVKQNNGYIDVESVREKGTTFRIYFPRYTGGLASSGATSSIERPKGKETILLVEDDGLIRMTMRAFLETLGYTVLLAERPTEALRLAEEHAGVIALLLTDVVMPELSGRELANRLIAQRPALRCLFMSGYTADVIVHSGVLDEGVHFIAKPFNRDQLAHKVREVLDAK